MDNLPVEITNTPAAVGAPVEANAWLDSVNELTVETAEQAQFAGQMFKDISARHTTIEGLRKHLKEPSLETGRRIDAFFKGPLDTLARAKQLLQGKITAFQREEKRKADEEAARLRAEREAEQRRLQAEHEAKLAAMPAEHRQFEPEPELPAHSHPVAGTVPAVTKIAGVTSRTTWQAEIADKTAFVRAALERPELLECIEIKMPALHALARQQKAALAIPGVRAVEVQSLANR